MLVLVLVLVPKRYTIVALFRVERQTASMATSDVAFLRKLAEIKRSKLMFVVFTALTITNLKGKINIGNSILNDFFYF